MPLLQIASHAGLHLHAFRKPSFLHSQMMPDCDSDPTSWWLNTCPPQAQMCRTHFHLDGTHQPGLISNPSAKFTFSNSVIALINPMPTVLPENKPNTATQLISALQTEGWTVTYHIATITSSGQVFKNVSDSAAFFGIPEPNIQPLLQRLHVHTVKSAFYIVKLRRRLENNPAHFHASDAHEDHPRPP